jgi:hypothetical protein
VAGDTKGQLAGCGSWECQRAACWRWRLGAPTDNLLEVGSWGHERTACWRWRLYQGTTCWEWKLVGAKRQHAGGGELVAPKDSLLEVKAGSTKGQLAGEGAGGTKGHLAASGS